MDKLDKLVKLVLSELGELTPKTKYNGNERTTSLYNKNGSYPITWISIRLQILKYKIGCVLKQQYS